MRKRNVWVFPMAGLGKRTSSIGDFKPFVEIHGRKILEWNLRSITDKIAPSDTLVFVTTKDFENRYSVKLFLKTMVSELNLRNRWELVLCDDVPPGPAASVYQARHFFSREDLSVCVCNTDQVISYREPLEEEMRGFDGYLVLYCSFSEKASYAKLDGCVINGIVEKKVISNTASAGVYAFNNGLMFTKAMEHVFRQEVSLNGEYYVSQGVDYLVCQGVRFRALPAVAKFDLGNPASIEHFAGFLANIGYCPLE